MGLGEAGAPQSALTGLPRSSPSGDGGGEWGVGGLQWTLAPQSCRGVLVMPGREASWRDLEATCLPRSLLCVGNDDSHLAEGIT